MITSAPCRGRRLLELGLALWSLGMIVCSASHADRLPPSIIPVDWYRAPARDPDETPASKRIHITSALIENVPRSFHREATALLRSADIVEITPEQAKRFGFRNVSDVILKSLIQKNRARISELKSGSPERDGSHGQALASLVKELDGESKQYEHWIGRLKPYLVKAVAFSYLPQGFTGELISDDFIITFGTVLEGSGGRLVMVRMPTVAYLPKRPRRVFTDLHNMY